MRLDLYKPFSISRIFSISWYTSMYSAHSCEALGVVAGGTFVHPVIRIISLTYIQSVF